MNNLYICLWNKYSAKEEPLGHILFSKALITSGQMDDDQWFELNSVENNSMVSGDIRIKISYFPPKTDIRSHTFVFNGKLTIVIQLRQPEIYLLKILKGKQILMWHFIYCLILKPAVLKQQKFTRTH